MLRDGIAFYDCFFWIVLVSSYLLINAESSIKRIKEDTERLITSIIVYPILFVGAAILVIKIPYIANGLHDVIEGTVVNMEWSNNARDKTIAKYYNGN